MTQTTPDAAVADDPIRVDTRVVLVDADYETGAKVPWTVRAIRLFFLLVGTVLPGVAGWLAEKMFFAPRRHAVPPREAAWLENAVRKDVAVEGTSVATYRWGDGPRVLLVHGWEGRGSQMGAFVGPLVAAGYTAIAVDLPAHGRSSGRRTDAFACGRVIRALAREEGGLHAIVAHSFGGTCTMLAMADGLETDAAALISPGVQGESFFRGFATIIGLPARALSVLRRRVEAHFGEDAWDQFTPRQHGYTLGLKARRAFLVHDINDAEVPYTESVQLAHHTEGARLLSTRGLGHRRILRDPSVVAAVVSFVGGHDAEA